MFVDELTSAEADHECPTAAAAQDISPTHRSCCPFDAGVDRRVGDDSLLRIGEMKGWHDDASGLLQVADSCDCEELSQPPRLYSLAHS